MSIPTCPTCHVLQGARHKPGCPWTGYHYPGCALDTDHKGDCYPGCVMDTDHKGDRASAVRTFDTGATRDTEEGKLDYEGFISPFVLKRYAEYMHEHRLQGDGTLRDSDNWQKGMTLAVYTRSLIRHVMDFWMMRRAPVVDAKAEQDALCAILFNAMGYLFQRLTKGGSS